MDLIKKLKEAIPEDVSKITLEVNSIPGFFDSIYAHWNESGVLFRGETNEGNEFEGSIRNGLFGTYNSSIRDATEACAYFSARGIEAHLIDSREDGTYIPLSDRTA